MKKISTQSNASFHDMHQLFGVKYTKPIHIYSHFPSKPIGYPNLKRSSQTELLTYDSLIILKYTFKSEVKLWTLEEQYIFL